MRHQGIKTIGEVDYEEEPQIQAEKTYGNEYNVGFLHGAVVVGILASVAMIIYHIGM